MVDGQRKIKNLDKGIWRYFRDGNPEYLARHYWWAYLWSVSVWFFDHQPIINAILFGQYKTLSRRAIQACCKNRPPGRFLQLTCAYGSLTTSLLDAMDDELYLLDVANIQLAATRDKLDEKDKKRLISTCMNAECLAYPGNAFGTVLIFFLLHELPPDARERSIREAIRVLQPGGRLVIAEYRACPTKHFLWRCWPAHALLIWLEPFLKSFWCMDLSATLLKYADEQGKVIHQVDEFHCFSKFYCVCVFEIDQLSTIDQD